MITQGLPFGAQPRGRKKTKGQRPIRWIRDASVLSFEDRSDANKYEQQARLLLSARDAEILQFIYDNMYVARDQLAEIFFPSLPTCQHRMKRLADLGLVERIRPFAVDGERQQNIRMPYVYGIGPIGVRILKKERYIAPQTSGFVDVTRWVAAVPHALATIDFYLALRRAAEANGHAVLTWIGTRRLAQDLRTIRALGEHLPKDEPFGREGYPDAWFAYYLGNPDEPSGGSGRTITAFLELDRGTEGVTSTTTPHRAFVVKADHYRSLKALHPNTWRAFTPPEFHHLARPPFPPVLVVTTGKERRLSSLRAAIAGMRHGNVRWFFTTTERLANGENVLGQVWTPLEGDPHIRVSLLEMDA